MPRPRPLALAVVLLALTGALALAGCGHGSPGRPLALPGMAGLPASASSHVAVIVLENEEASSVLGSPQAPYLNALARRFAHTTASFGVSHPSLPNYLAMVGGSTFGISSDCTDCGVDAPDLGGQLSAAGVSWRAYMEDLPRPCDTVAGSGGYAKKHDPFLYFRSLVRDPAQCGRVVPYPALGSDLRAGRLPAFVWITPNLCDDGHDCPLSRADRFLAGVAPALLTELGPRGILVVTFDEGSSDAGCCGGLARGGRVLTVVAGPGARRGAVVGTPLSSYSLLRTVEQAFRLPLLGAAASPHTAGLDGLLRSAEPLR